ncbi:hypothetical protein KKG66_06050 [bacterium]|nr:hypothetical protein [bacterium]
MSCREFLMHSLLCLCLLLCSGSAVAEIVAAEYFIDNDPGIGSGTSITITSGDTVNSAILADMTGFEDGSHRFFIRYQDETGRWGVAVASWFFLLPSGSSGYEERALTTAEYFFDSNPGVGSGTPLSVTPGDEINLTELIYCSGLGIGTHRLSIRYQDDTGVWGFPEARLFYIIPNSESDYEARFLIAAEYFFDSDPGEGNGTSISIESLEEASLLIQDELSDLPQGPHRFLIRYQDDQGRWSGVEGLRFFILPEQTPPPVQSCFTAAEFFVNVDPGVGLGIPLLPEDGVWDERDETVVHAISGIPAGKHWIGIRFQDDAGHWSITLADSFIVEPVLTIRISGSAAILDWITAGDPTTFHVLRSENSDGVFSEIGTTSDTTFTDSGIIDVSDVGFYQVTRDLNARGESAFRLPARNAIQEQ